MTQQSFQLELFNNHPWSPKLSPISPRSWPASLIHITICLYHDTNHSTKPQTFLSSSWQWMTLLIQWKPLNLVLKGQGLQIQLSVLMISIYWTKSTRVNLDQVNGWLNNILKVIAREMISGPRMVSTNSIGCTRGPNINLFSPNTNPKLYVLSDRLGLFPRKRS